MKKLAKGSAQARLVEDNWRLFVSLCLESVNKQGRENAAAI